MRSLLKFLLGFVAYFSPEVNNEDVAVKKIDSIIRYMEIPNRALTIYSRCNHFYEAYSGELLPNNCMEIVEDLSRTRYWHYKAREYLTTHDWVAVLKASNPKVTFASKVVSIHESFDL